MWTYELNVKCCPMIYIHGMKIHTNDFISMLNMHMSIATCIYASAIKRFRKMHSDVSCYPKVINLQAQFGLLFTCHLKNLFRSKK